MTYRTSLLVVVPIAALSGCVDESSVFTCSTDETCERNGAAGTCEPSRFCSFEAPECASGRRYTEHADDALATTCVAEACPGNLVMNPSFDTGSSGWVGINASLALVPGRRGNALQGCLTTGSYFSISDNPSTVLSPVLGTTYRLSLWARGESAAPESYGVIREIGPTDYVDHIDTKFALSTDWQEVVVSYTVLASDSLAIEIYTGVTDPTPGTCLQVDDVCLVAPP